jgi:hypothetical protein
MSEANGTIERNIRALPERFGERISDYARSTTMPSTRLGTLFGLVKRQAAPLAFAAALITGGTALAAPSVLPAPLITANSIGAPIARPRPTPPPRATVTPVSDPTAALSTCASNIFGLTLTYTKSGGANATIMRSLAIPTKSQGTLTGVITADATAVYGLTNNSGVEVLVYGSGSASGTNASLDVSTASLCYLQFTRTQAAPASADAALALLKSTFPGVPQKTPYVTVQSGKGGYLFYIATKHVVQGSTQTTAQAIMLAATPTANGKLILSATSGTGTYAAAVPQK